MILTYGTSRDGGNFMNNPELKHTDKFGNHKFDQTKAGSLAWL